MMRIILLAFLFLSVFHVSEALPEIKCVNSEGEAVIVSNDIPSGLKGGLKGDGSIF